MQSGSQPVVSLIQIRSQSRNEIDTHAEHLGYT